jgi:hypothetical protein
MQMNKLALSMAALGLFATATVAADKIESGLKPGEGTTPFQVVDVTGPNKPKQLCYVWANGGAPVVVAFVKDEPAKAAGLVASIQKLVDANKDKDLRSFVVFMNGPELAPQLTKLAQEKGIKLPMTVLPGGANAPDLGHYKVNPQAKNTILVYRRQRIHANFVNVGPSDFTAVEKATAEMLAK